MNHWTQLTLTRRAHGEGIRVISVLEPTHTPAFLSRPPQTDICVSCGISVAGHQLAWGYQRRLVNGLQGKGTAVISTITTH